MYYKMLSFNYVQIYINADNNYGNRFNFYSSFSFKLQLRTLWVDIFVDDIDDSNDDIALEEQSIKRFWNYVRNHKI
jgi:hypothetical protein